MNNLIQDIRYGLRSLWRQPGFTLVAVCSLALGIGANAALFSVVNGVLLNPLPYPQPEQLVTLHQSKPNFETGAIPYPNFRDLQKENQTFSAMAISRGYGFSLIGAGEAERVNGRWVSADFFSVLGVKPALGRTFAPGEDEPGAAPVALISQDLWQRKFGSAPDVLAERHHPGRQKLHDCRRDPRELQLSCAAMSMCRSASGTIPRSRIAARFGPARHWPAQARRHYRTGAGRSGQSDAGSRDAYPDTNKGNGAELVPLKERMVGDIGPILWMLLGAVGFVLLIACVNVSNLLLARSTGRTREFAIRAALGAGQWRLLRQSLTESTLLALLGGALGLVVAGWGTQLALKVLPTALPRAEEIRLDGRVLLFTFAISLLTGVLAGLAPALKISQGAFRKHSRKADAGRAAGAFARRAFWSRSRWRWRWSC